MVGGPNAATLLHVTPCSPSPFVYVQLAFESFGWLIYTHLLPTKRTIVKEVLGVLTDCGFEWNAEGAQALEDITSLPGIDFLWDLTGIVGEGAFYFWIAESAIAGVSEFTTLVQQYNGDCPPSSWGPVQIKSNTDTVLGPGDTGVIASWDVVYDPGNWTEPPNHAGGIGMIPGTYGFMYQGGSKDYLPFLPKGVIGYAARVNPGPHNFGPTTGVPVTADGKVHYTQIAVPNAPVTSLGSDCQCQGTELSGSGFAVMTNCVFAAWLVS